MNPKTDPIPAEHARKPRLSLFFATAAGAGYLPKAPGTWGSVVGVALYRLVWWIYSRFGPRVAFVTMSGESRSALWMSETWARIRFFEIPLLVGLAVALLGAWVSSRAARWSSKKDPQFVVIDEVSGQFFTYLFALAPLSWKYLLLGFILFRVFDIWKPFPARQAESLPGGWGIMADDWIAAVYAAIGIWIARGLGL
ncbi:MAG TPA: phosphatidylglycerophosphatase A [Candidatus Acidoferrales bacterium]|nr:phosphatidylglycerophosphatase A [Candidatus Acidoferrales bacterium]